MLEFLFNSMVALISFSLWLVFSAFMVWMIIDCATKEPRQGNERLIWIIITVFVPYVGAIIYYLVRRPERIRAYGI
jgi:Phospholipase_D-nuclease N-terminal